MLVVTLLPSCTHDPYFKPAPTSLAYKDAPASILNRGYITRESKRALGAMQKEGRTIPTTQNQRIAVAEQEISRAKKQVRQSRTSAISHYIQAATTLWPVVKNTRYPQEKPHKGEGERLLIAHQLYIHAVGQTVKLLTETQIIKPKQSSVQLGDVTLTINTTTPNTLHPSYFDRIDPIDNSRYGNIGPGRYKTFGVGAATNAHRDWTAQRAKNTPIIPPHGIDMPVNAMIDFNGHGQPRLTLTNLLKTEIVNIAGETRRLSSDYSSTVAAMMSRQSSLLGLVIAMNPKIHDQDQGLFALGPFDPDKIPVIFVHGLISQPATWTRTSNYLLQDKKIRENYQFYYYFYATGVTPFLSGIKFREILLEFYKRHDNEAHDKLHRTVLVGHSMGGILSSIQSRQFNDELWNSIFKGGYKPDDAENPLKTFHILFDPPQLTPIERTIFVSTPHRGSQLANGLIGKIGNALIQLPKTELITHVETTLNYATDLGHAIIGSDEKVNSVTRLKANNLALTLLTKQPFNSRVTYHSIIGDRGKGNSPDSSDGVVPYWSSHLDGAASEKIVPSNHEAPLHPMTNKEIQRILHLHLLQN